MSKKFEDYLLQRIKFNQILGSLEINENEAKIMMTLYNHEAYTLDKGLSMEEIYKNINDGLSMATYSVASKQLRIKNQIEKSINMEDERKRVVWLTEKGTSTCKNLEKKL